MKDIMKFDTILFEQAKAIAIVTLNQADKLNLITDKMFKELMEVFKYITDEESIKAVVLMAAGRVFSGGVDLKEHFLDPIEKAKQGELNLALEHSFSEVGLPTILNINKPTIVAINGAAVGLGFTLCLPFDIRIASKNAKIVLPFLGVGLTPEFGSTYFLTRLIGVSRSLELLYTGRSVKAQEAKELGLVNKVVADDQLRETTLKTAEQIAKQPEIAIKLTRELVLQGAKVDIETAVKAEHFAYNVCRQTRDHEEAVRAFLEKRTPIFKGK